MAIENGLSAITWVTFVSALLILPILVSGFALGLVHALDPDHLMTIASLSAGEDSKRVTLRNAALWAVGHGGLLVTIAVVVVFAGWSVPTALPHGAERLIGLILIIAGASALWLRHPPHAHRSTLRQRAPVLVGAIHGLAGSAAMLALIPLSLSNPIAGLVYTLTFSVGVLAGMTGFGMILGHVQHRLVELSPTIHRTAGGVTGALAMVMGAYWLQAST